MLSVSRVAVTDTAACAVGPYANGYALRTYSATLHNLAEQTVVYLGDADVTDATGYEKLGEDVDGHPGVGVPVDVGVPAGIRACPVRGR